MCLNAPSIPILDIFMWYSHGNGVFQLPSCFYNSNAAAFANQPTNFVPIIAPNDNNKHNFLYIVLMSWSGLHESEDIKQMITLTVIPLSGVYGTYNDEPFKYQALRCLLFIQMVLFFGCAAFGSPFYI